ncbi:MAG: SCO family protein [Bacteroidetes bacterium]|jgi:protein SCO1/2|nr:SCO family protein [Bacteroidota bacterium]
MHKIYLNIILALAAVGILIGGYVAFNNGQQVRELPYFEPIEQGLKNNTDSLNRHLVFDFSLTDQTGKTVTRKDFENSITVVDFFFTSCQGICPKMNSQLKRVYENYKGNPEVKFLSHTVNPEKDSAEVLAEYAKHYNADANQWHFVTGDKPQLYKLARKSYLISNTNGNGGKEDFVHSQNFALIDKAGHIRGVYDGTDSVEVNRLMVDMNVLLGSYFKK